MPRVSVVLPTHNRAALLGRAIRSVLAQTLQDLELIVVDDASTDATAGVVRAFTDGRLRYIRLPRNMRAAAARNVGIREARADLVAFQDDDDVWLIQKLEKQVASLAAAPPRVGLDICGYVRLRAAGHRYRGGRDDFAQIDFSTGHRRGAGLIATPGWLVRKRCLEQAGLFDERMLTWDDWELALRLSDVCEFRHTDEPLYLQDRMQGGGMWRAQHHFSNDMQVIMEKHGMRWARQPDVLARHCYMIGRSEAQFGTAAAARHWLLRALRHRPAFARAWALLALGLLGKSPVAAASRAARRISRLVRAGS